MNFKYIPILKWKAGEQRTLRELQAMDRRHSLPLVELLPLNDRACVPMPPPRRSRAIARRRTP